MSAGQKKAPGRAARTATSMRSVGAARGSAGRSSRPASKRTQGKRTGGLSGLSAGMPKRGGVSQSRGMPKRGGATQSRGRKSKAKQGGLEQLMGKVAGAAGGAKSSSKRGPALMALVGAGGAGIAALGKKRKAKDQANEPAPGPQVHMGAAETAEPVVVQPEDITGPKNAGA